MENRVAQSEDDLSVIENDIDFDNVNNVMKKMRSDSLNWIEDVIKN